eukprot:sb/3469772/
MMSKHWPDLAGQCSDHSSRALREKRESGQANALTDSYGHCLYHLSGDNKTPGFLIVRTRFDLSYDTARSCYFRNPRSASRRSCFSTTGSRNLVKQGNTLQQEPTEIKTSKQPIRTPYLGHVTGYQPIRDQYFLIRSVPALQLCYVLTKHSLTRQLNYFKLTIQCSGVFPNTQYHYSLYLRRRVGTGNNPGKQGGLIQISDGANALTTVLVERSENRVRPML